jgi:uncharacterized membrane protein
LIALSFPATSSAANDHDDWLYTTIDFPGARSTEGYDMNARGVIVGSYIDTVGHQHAYVRDRLGEFTTFDFPGANSTKALGINSRGDIVGNYLLPGESMRHGFLLVGGSFTSFDPPGSLFTQPYGINDRGEITGRYCTIGNACFRVDSEDFHGFLFRSGEYTTIDFPGGHETHCYKSNSRGEIVGSYIGDTDGRHHVFLLTRHGQFITIDFPGAFETDPNPGQGGINSDGDVVSYYCAAEPCDADSGNDHGFLLTRGVFIAIDFPGAATTFPTDITRHGDIVGSYHIANAVGDHGFVFHRADRDNSDEHHGQDRKIQ